MANKQCRSTAELVRLAEGISFGGLGGGLDQGVGSGDRRGAAGQPRMRNPGR